MARFLLLGSGGYAAPPVLMAHIDAGKRTLQSIGPAPTIGPRSVGDISPREPSLLGTVVGERYRIEEQIASGSTADVFRARHEVIERTVAIKIVPPELKSEAWLRDAILREARLMAKLRHENVVDVLDFGVHEDSAWVAMEYLEGESLAARIEARGPMPWPTVRTITRQLCRALASAHEVGVIHRDLKPHNISCLPREAAPDFVKLIDFGIAVVETRRGIDQITPPGIVAGTPEYMAPEMFSGACDERSDVYALGVVMYQMLTGNVPYPGDSPLAVLGRLANESPRPPSSQMSMPLPPGVDAIVLRALAKKPENRFQHMRDVLDALELEEHGFLDAIRWPSRDEEEREQPGKRTSKRSWTRGLALGTGVAAAAAVGLVLTSPMLSDRDLSDTMSEVLASVTTWVPELQLPWKMVRAAEIPESAEHLHLEPMTSSFEAVAQTATAAPAHLAPTATLDEFPAELVTSWSGRPWQSEWEPARAGAPHFEPEPEPGTHARAEASSKPRARRESRTMTDEVDPWHGGG